MTERQEKCYDYLSSIVLDPNLELQFLTSRDVDDQKSRAYISAHNDGKVVLVLSPVYDDDGLKEWEEAIMAADRYLLNKKAEEKHDANHPDFFTAVRNRIRCLRKYNSVK